MKPLIVITDLDDGTEDVVREMTDEEYAEYEYSIANMPPPPVIEP
jgi:hypothetical protein